MVFIVVRPKVIIVLYECVDGNKLLANVVFVMVTAAGVVAKGVV